MKPTAPYVPKLDDYVTFRTASFRGLSAPLRGVVVSIRSTARGAYYGVQQATGAISFTRAARMTPARGRRPFSLAQGTPE